MSDSTKLANSLELLAIFLAAFSLVEFALDLLTFSIGLATIKSIAMLIVSISLYLSLKKPELFKIRT